MALSRFWLFIIVVSILSLLFAVVTGNQYSLEHILTGNTNDDDPLRRRLVIAEYTFNELQQKDSLTALAFQSVKPSDKFQKSLKKTELFAFISVNSDTVKGRIESCSYYDLTNKGFLNRKSVTMLSREAFEHSSGDFLKPGNIGNANIVYCSVINQRVHLDSVMAYGNVTSDSIALRRYNIAPLSKDIDELWNRMLKDENPIIATQDTVYDLKASGTVQLSTRTIYSDGILSTCVYVVNKLWIPLLGILIFLCGLMNLLKESQMNEKLARFLSPFFKKIFPELKDGHPAFNFMTLNFAANFLGLDNAATPFGLKAMESMQEDNPDKTKASNSQIMFLCLHAAGLTLIPTSIIGYRAVMNAANPADVMIPIIITSFMGTMAALIFVSIKQRINLFNKPVVIVVAALVIVLSVLFAYMSRLTDISKNQFTGNLGVGIFLAIIAMVLIYSFVKEKLFTSKGTNIFASFVEGSKEGIETAFRILPYMIAMLVAISIFRNSGLMSWVMEGLTKGLLAVGVKKDITNAIPVALLRPFSAGGARAFMFDAMQHYGADSLTGRLACLFEGAAETTFYVIAVYYGAVNIKDTRYTLSIMLLADLVCIITAMIVAVAWF
jgi:spore maturation protein SpmA